MRLFHFSLLLTLITGLNPSQEDPSPSRLPHTDSDSDLASPSRDGSPGVTHLPDVFRFRGAHTLRTASARQGGERSGAADKTGLLAVPQEGTHNGQEKAGSLISDLVYTATRSLPDSPLSITERERDAISVGTLTTPTSTGTLPENLRRTTTDIHDDTDTLLALDPTIAHSSDITVMSSAPRSAVVANGESHRIGVTDRRGVSVMSSSSSEARNVAHQSSQTFRDRIRLPHPNLIKHNTPGLSVTQQSNFLSDAASDLAVSEFTYRRDTAETDTSRANRFPESTPANENVSDGTHSSRIMTETPGAFVSPRHIDTFTLSDRSSDATGMTNGKRAEFYSDAPYYTDSPASDSTHTELATAPEQTSTRHVSDATHHTPSEILPTRSGSGSGSSSATWSLQDTTSYSPNALGEPINSTTPQSSVLTSIMTSHGNVPTATDDTAETETSAGTEIRTPHDDGGGGGGDDGGGGGGATEMITGLNLGTESRPTTVTHFDTSWTSGYEPVTVTTLNRAVTPPSRLTSPSTHTPDAGTTGTPAGNLHTSQTGHVMTTARRSETPPLNRLTTGRSRQIVQRHETPPTPTTPTTPTTPPTPPTTPPTPPPTTPTTSTTPPTPPPTTQTTSTTPTTPPTPPPTTPTTSTTPPPPPTKSTTPTTPPTTPTPPTPTPTPTTPTTTQQEHTKTPPGSHTPLTPVNTRTSSLSTFATESDKERSHKGRVFIMADQPAITEVETFQVLLQVILEDNSAPFAGLVEVEPFLQSVAGYQSQHVTWHSGAVLQSVVTFRTTEAVSWLGRAESLLREAGLKPLPARGVFVSGVRVKNITVGGLHSDVCSWLFSCPSNFYCVSSNGNVTCRSVCHSEFCQNHGICVHRPGQNPLCQCPVGEDFWFMGQHCDLRMTRQRLAGVCFGVLAAIAVLMGLLAFVAVQRFKKTLIQAKAEQTQSSYRRFNHFDELSARFWRRSWPGSEDSLDNTAFSRSDELLHMRALDRACCYHDDTLSIASTYPDSVTHLNTVYPHSSQYHWDMSTCSLADGVIDSGKASDLSVCSWPIEPIQWTPFPLLQQLRSTNTVKPSRPRSYCEGMELVGLEKSRTA